MTRSANWISVSAVDFTPLGNPGKMRAKPCDALGRKALATIASA
jgi:hypothetical protein